mmetsp:Transcript_20085/g.30853  ORF Transcript_20085/g.30853 Transcript_20085/m.30853 type:complete len:157 (+) Transcript_20085:566-1036(+)
MTEQLSANDITFEFFDTTGPLSAMHHVAEFDIDSYSAIFIAGGDGTIHEVINGLMTRKDHKRLPVALIPKGSGNDTCYGLSISKAEHSLQYILKKDVLKIDVLKILIDFDTEEELDQAVAEGRLNDEGKPIIKSDYLRYSIINSTYALLASVCKNA